MIMIMHSGYFVMVAKGFVSWKSVKKTLTTSSTIGGKVCGVFYEAACHAIWLRNFISSLKVVHFVSKPLKLLCDNSATIPFSRNTRSVSRSKHIDVKFYLLKRKLQSFSFQLSTRL